MKHRTASGEWQTLDMKRTTFIDRCIQYAGWTLPRLYPPRGFDQLTQEQGHEWQSVGAQAVNHVVNKLVLSLFAPSRPFMRLEASKAFLLQAAQQGLKEEIIVEALTEGERKATRELDKLGIRPDLYTSLQHLVALGNVCTYMPNKEKEDFQVYGLDEYVVRRTQTGKIKTLIIRECLHFAELEPVVQKAARENGTYDDEDKVEHFRWIERQADGKYRMSQWIDNQQLPEEFSAFWPADKMPYHALTWNLNKKAHYGAGLVEDYSADFAALSALSQAQVEGAILASEFRWLVNPGGLTSPEDLANSKNGDALPGLKDDVNLVSNSKPGDLQVVKDVNADYVRRIGYGFLLNSAVTRDAERVTAEEIKTQALELETSFGGTYSRLAGQYQRPLAHWLLKSAKIDIQGTQVEVTIITGLDALSRSGDLDNLRAALSDIAQIQALAPQVLARLNLEAVLSAIFAGHNLSKGKFVKSEAEAAAEMQQEQAAQQQSQQNQAVQNGVAQAAGNAAVQAAVPQQP